MERGETGAVSYSEAKEYSELSGLESYKIQENPEYSAAFKDVEYFVEASDSDSDSSDASFGRPLMQDELEAGGGARRR